MSILSLPQCPTDCAGSLPAVDFDLCAPVVHYGEIAFVYMGRADSSNFDAVHEAAEWILRLDQADPGVDFIRTLTVLGELGEPDQSEVSISGDRSVVGFKQFSLAFEVDETNDTNYEFLLNYECDIKSKIWFETADGILYGGNEGILATARMNNTIPKDRAEVAKFIGTAKWKSKHSPLRCVSPIA